jgi:5'-nucleotidase
VIMNRRVFLRNTTIGSAGFLLGAVPYELMASNDHLVLTILHTNDLHSRVEPFEESHAMHPGKAGFGRISAMIKNIRSKNRNTLVFDAGDSFQGTPYFNFYGGELIFRLMSAAGFEASTIGNHEFDAGLEGLNDAMKSAEFPIICSNYDFSDTILAGQFPRWKIFRKSGINVGVYGLGIELNGLVSLPQRGNTIFIDPLKTALEMEHFLKYEKACDLVVCISHLGLRYREKKISDVILAEQTYSTDLIIGGHTHSFLENPLTLTNRNNLPVVVNQAWWGGLVLGKIDFVFERTRNKKEGIFASNIII